MTDTCQHCAHYAGSGMGLDGYTMRLICCQCGRYGMRREGKAPDPEHGPYAPKITVALPDEWDVKP